MPKKLILLLIVSGLLLISGHPVLANQEFKTKLEELTTELTAEVIQRNAGYIIKKSEAKVYINLGQESGVKVGDKFKVMRSKEVLTNPITGVAVGKISHQIAEIEVTEVKEKFSAAEVENYYHSVELQPSDEVLPVPHRVGVLKFSGVETSGLEKAVYNRLLVSLAAEDQLTVAANKLSQLAEKLSTEEPITKETQKLISESLNLDLLITGEIYQEEGKTFVHGKLYNKQINNIQTEAVVAFSAENKLVNYYQTRGENTFSLAYKLLKQDTVDYQAFSISVANIDEDKKEEVILTTEQGLKILAYDKELQTKKTVEDYTRTEYDDYKVVAGKLTAGSAPKIWGENYNQLVEISRQEADYKIRQVSDFARNRPKGIASWGEKRYLLTRDAQHYLKFNISKAGEYKTDFKLDLEPDEGYRVETADVDGDEEQEILLTVYQSDNKYKIRIYNINGELETSLPGNYGSGFTVLKSTSPCLIALYTTEDEEQKIILYKYQQGEYQKAGEISDFELPIKSLTIGDINEGQRKQLFVLAGNENQSQVYTYQVRAK